jgi:hypothetical protein
VKDIYKEDELDKNSTTEGFSVVRKEGNIELQEYGDSIDEFLKEKIEEELKKYLSVRNNGDEKILFINDGWRMKSWNTQIGMFIRSHIRMVKSMLEWIFQNIRARGFILEVHITKNSEMIVKSGD